MKRKKMAFGTKLPVKTENKKLQKELDRLFDKLQTYLDTNDDQDV